MVVNDLFFDLDAEISDFSEKNKRKLSLGRLIIQLGILALGF